jgi:hypothetical protein
VLSEIHSFINKKQAMQPTVLVKPGILAHLFLTVAAPAILILTRQVF